MANKKFSQFTNGSTMKVGDQVVGLRAGDNTRFAFPGSGIQDANAVNLITWTGVGSAVNYLTLVNAIAGAGPTIGTAGVSAAIPLTLTTTGAANLILAPASTGIISAQAAVRFGSGFGIQTGTTVGNTALLQAYNTGGASYTTFGTLTAGTTPSLAFGLISATNLNLGFTTTATAAGTTTLTVANTQIQEFTGSTTQTVVMPVTSTLTLGQQFYIINNSSGVVTVQSSGANTIQAMAAGTSALLTVILTSGTTAASWQSTYIADGGGTVNSGTANQLGYYATTGNAISGLTSANNGLLVTGNTGVPSILAGPGTTGNILQSNAAAAPSFSTATYPSVATGTGTILRANGTNWLASTATFADTYAVSTILYAGSSNAVSGLATANSAILVTGATGIPVMSGTMTNGQLIIGSTGATPTAATLTAGAGISITNGAASITITATGSGMGWNTIAGTTQAAAVDTGYVSGNAAQTTVTLPATASVGSVVAVEGLGAGGWILAANTGQTIKIGSSTTSSAGSLTSAAASDNVYVVAIVANTTWRVQHTNSAGLTVA